jgi:hypothetical protein
MRRFWPDKYCRMMLRRARADYNKGLEKPGIEDRERNELHDEFQHSQLEWDEWLRELNTQDLERRGRRVGVLGDEVPQNLLRGRYAQGQFGNRYLEETVLAAYRKLVRDAEVVARKERREKWTLVIQVIVAIAGLAGVITGLIATATKSH